MKFFGCCAVTAKKFSDGEEKIEIEGRAALASNHSHAQSLPSDDDDHRLTIFFFSFSAITKNDDDDFSLDACATNNSDYGGSGGLKHHICDIYFQRKWERIRKIPWRVHARRQPKERLKALGSFLSLKFSWAPRRVAHPPPPPFLITVSPKEYWRQRWLLLPRLTSTIISFLEESLSDDGWAMMEARKKAFTNNSFLFIVAQQKSSSPKIAEAKKWDLKNRAVLYVFEEDVEDIKICEKTPNENHSALPLLMCNIGSRRWRRKVTQKWKKGIWNQEANGFLAMIRGDRRIWGIWIKTKFKNWWVAKNGNTQIQVSVKTRALSLSTSIERRQTLNG